MLLLVGCVGSIVETGQANSNVSADAGPGGGDCDPQVASSGSGHHNPGQACLSCHKSGGSAPAFTLAGTVLDGTSSDVAMAGVTIRITDANGTQLSLTTGDNGNFYTDQALAFPVATATSSCPNTFPMLSPVQSTGGDCNSAGCHVSGFRIHAQ